MESNETKAGVSPVLSTDGLCGCGREARYMVMRDGKPVCACNKYMRCLTYEEQGEALRRANVQVLVLQATLELVRQYPDFDHGGPLAEAMDEALAGKVPTLINNLDALFARLPHNAQGNRLAALSPVRLSDVLAVFEKSALARRRIVRAQTKEAEKENARQTNLGA